MQISFDIVARTIFRNPRAGRAVVVSRRRTQSCVCACVCPSRPYVCTYNTRVRSIRISAGRRYIVFGRRDRTALYNTYAEYDNAILFRIIYTHLTMDLHGNQKVRVVRPLGLWDTFQALAHYVLEEVLNDDLSIFK